VSVGRKEPGVALANWEGGRGERALGLRGGNDDNDGDFGGGFVR